MDKLQYSNLLQIKEASKQGRLVVFVGAGVSSNSGVPTWSQLINEMKSCCGIDNETDDLKIAQLYKDARGDKEYMDKVKEILKHNKVSPNPIHKSILDLNPCHIITTNYDNLIEQEIEKEFKQFDIIREDKDIPNMSYPNSLIKMHGDFGKNNIVLTESDYYNYERNFPLIRSFILSLFASKLVVFIGFSFSDLNLKMILNDLRSVLHESMQRVYLISDTKPSQIINTYYEKKGINVVYLNDSELSEIYNIDNYEIRDLTHPKGVYLYKVLKCIENVTENRGRDIVSTLYSQLLEFKDELAVVGDGLKYFIPKTVGQMFHPHSYGLQLGSSYFETLHKQLNTYAGRRKFILDHPDVDWKILKQLAYNNYLFEIDNVVIVDSNKQYELDASLGKSSALWYLYHFDFNNLRKRLLQLSARELSGDSKDLEYPFILYKLGDYYEAYKEYNKILPIAWERKKYILYFICLYNLWSIRNGVHMALFMEDAKLAKKIHDKLSSIKLDEVLGRLPIPEGIRKTFQDLLTYRALGDCVVETGDKKEQIFQQRKSSEKGGYSINSNISSLLSKFERTFKFCNNNFIVCDNNNFYKAISYNTVCGVLNSYATSDVVYDGFGFGIRQTKIDKMFTFCIFSLVYCVEPKKLKEIFRRYEIDSIELTDEAIESINNYWINLIETKHNPYVNNTVFGDYLENLIYVTSKINNDGIHADNIYKVVLKFWDCIASLKINGDSLSLLLSRREPSKEILCLLLDRLSSNLNKYDNFGDCYEWITHYMSKLNGKYELDLSKIKDGKYASDLYHLYKILTPTIQEEFSCYCQKHLYEVADYLDFIINNHLNVLSSDDFAKQIDKIKETPTYYKSHCCWQLAKMRRNEQYSGVHNIIDDFSNDNDCMAFFKNPFEYKKKGEVDAEWILTTGNDGVPQLAKIPEYKEILKQYLENHPFISHKRRMMIINVL